MQTASKQKRAQTRRSIPNVETAIKMKNSFNIIQHLLFFFAIIIASESEAQHISPQTEISVITCDEGDEIYSLFGHSALHFNDPVTQTNVVYNWGMFEFGENELEFEIKFAKGKLRYYMAEETYENFMWTYQWEHRTVREQILNLTPKQKQALWEEVQWNYRPENRYYKYDFFFDNCSTRIAAIIRKSLGNSLIEKKLPEAGKYTYRQLIDKQVHHSQPWSDFGIDLALGAKIDKKTTSEEMQFLPKYLEKALSLDSIKINNTRLPFVKETRLLLKGKNRETQNYEGITPTEIAWAILIMSLLIHIFNVPYLLPVFDGVVFFTYGVLGVVVLLLWVATDHQATKLNYNLLWANPIHLIAFIGLFSKKIQEKLSLFYLVMAFYSFAIILFWIAIPQEFHEAFRPLILTLVLTYYYWFRKVGQ